MNIVIIEEIEMYRGALFDFLETAGHFVMKYSSIDDFSPPPPVLIDLIILGKDKRDLSGVGELLEFAPVLIVSSIKEISFIKNVLITGASYKSRSEDKICFIDAINIIKQGELYMSDQVKNNLIKLFLSSGIAVSWQEVLTEKEKEIFNLIGKGLRAKEIMIAMNIGRPTVDAHKMNIKRKLGLKNSKDLLKKAVQEYVKLDLPSENIEQSTPIQTKPLIKREKKIYEMLGQGMGLKEIAEECNLKKATLQVYMSNIKTKMGSASREELITKAIEDYRQEGDPQPE